MTSLHRADGVDRIVGLFGPSSMTWRLAREACMFLGGPRALLMQLAHPAVAAVIESGGQRTFECLRTITFGDRGQAQATLRRLARRHVDSDGADQAEDPAMLLWVHATLVDTALYVHSAVSGPLAAQDAERYWEEHRHLAMIVGIPAAQLPVTLADLRAYVDGMVRGPVLQVGSAARAGARALARTLSTPQLVALHGEASAERWKLLVERAPLRAPPAQLAQLLAAGMLPVPLRRAYGYAWGQRQQLAYDGLMSLARVGSRRALRRIRYVPGFHAAVARVRDMDHPALRDRPVHAPRV